MTSREIVIKALEFHHPERIPMALPEPYPNDFCGGGIAGLPGDRSTGWVEQDDGSWEMVDVFGNVWRRLEQFSKGEVHRPVLREWTDLDDYEWPDLDNPARYQAAAQAFTKSPDRYRLAGIPGFPFNLARKMRRMDQYLTDLLLEREWVDRLNDALADLLDRCIVRLAEAGADGFIFCEDWGTQDHLLIRPDLWREAFKPHFARLCATARQHNLHVWMHSCGYIADIIEDLIEVGVSVLQLDQPALFGIEWLGKKFGGRVNFWCPVDIQQTLQSRDPVRIEAEARQLIEKLGCFGGGFIAKIYSDNDSIGLEPKWQEIACEAFFRYGQY